MKVCTNCNLGYSDQAAVCPRCGNPNLMYYPNQGVSVKTSNFKFGEFFKTYFKSPISAKADAINRKDYGSALLMNGLTLISYYIYVICLQGGLSIRYHVGFSAVLSLLYPILFFAIIFGFQYLNVFLYSLYANSRKRLVNNKTALPVYIHLAGSRLFSVMLLFLASLFSLASPILGGIIVLAVISISIMSSVTGKIRYGMEPVTFADSLVFVIIGFFAFLFAVLLIVLFLYLYVRLRINAFDMIDYLF